MPPTSALEPLLGLRQHQGGGQRSPHKPLLALLALGRFLETGSSALTWSETVQRLADLVVDFGPPSRTSHSQSAAYPFTRLRSDGVWTLDVEVPMDRVGPLTENDPVGRFTPAIEKALTNPKTLLITVRRIVEAEFPPSLVPDVLTAVGFDPDEVAAAGTGVAVEAKVPRRRSGSWPAQILAAWDRACAFCGYDGQLGRTSVGLEAAHVRWFNHGGPDDLDNGLALCSLDHRLFDRGALGVNADFTIVVSDAFTARTDAGRRTYDLAGRELSPRPGAVLPSASYLAWHADQVFKGPRLAA
jgi:putative restriction endonuclease